MDMPGKQEPRARQRSIGRRQLLKTAGASVAAGAGLGLFGGKAPAFAQSRQIHVVAWGHFIPAADRMTERFAKEFEQATGVKVRTEFINANDLPARATAAVESGKGADIFQLQWNQSHQFAGGLENLNKLAAELGVKRDYEFLQDATRVDGTFRGIPYYAIGFANTYRKDWFQKLGLPDPNAPGIVWTWEEHLKAGTKLKQAGMPVGQTLGHAFGDAPAWCYPLLWSFGGREVDEKGKVAIDSHATAAAVAFMKEFWHAACDEGGMGWDSSSNNRAFLAETIGCTLNGASIYYVARNNPEHYRPGLADQIGHFLMPIGPAGRFDTMQILSHCIGAYSPEKGAAADWIRFIHQRKNYEDYIVNQKGQACGATPDWENHPFWKLDPAVEPFRQTCKYARSFGWPGPYNQKASEVQLKYIVIDMFALAVQGTPVKEAIAITERELKNVYERA
ncbi:MAG: ABC transporter substrate-binding protein [SAR324 cluster bacterium]